LASPAPPLPRRTRAPSALARTARRTARAGLASPGGRRLPGRPRPARRGCARWPRGAASRACGARPRRRSTWGPRRGPEGAKLRRLLPAPRTVTLPHHLTTSPPHRLAAGRRAGRLGPAAVLAPASRRRAALRTCIASQRPRHAATRGRGPMRGTACARSDTRRVADGTPLAVRPA